ncbi:APC family permease [Rubrobacter aplysinae]|uniref:APC family permease n=1 Tax=Rubrobacter aplysinae TaxID=909625 RepID=UPI00064BE40F|nr:APC family permease [Rubrobacter aplysinae]
MTESPSKNKIAADAEVKEDKGLRHDSVGILGSVVLGVSCVAPAYALTATLGPTVGEVGLQMPAIFLAGFIPMLLVAYAYRELNNVAPDCGTSFTWTVKAFGPHIGWMCGWGLVLATVIVLSNLVGVAVTFFYLMLGNIFGSQSIGALGDNSLVNVLTTLVFVAAATAISYRGMTATKELQYVLVGLQVVVLALFVTMAFAGGIGGGSSLAIGFSWSWLNPFAIQSFTAFMAGLSLSIFIFWGWDTTLTVNEETTASDKTPGRAALLTILTILGIYMLVAISAQMFAGIGTEGAGLGNPATEDNVFAALSGPVMGGLGIALFLAVMASAASSLQTTFLPAARTMLAMSYYKAAPEHFSRVHPRFQSPSFATMFSGVATAIFYTLMMFISENVLVDTIYSLGLMIAFYYSLTAFSCVWYFRGELLASLKNFLFKGLFPGLGGIMLAILFVKTAIDTWDPAYGTGGTIFGIGNVFVLGVGLLLLGIVLMFAWRLRAPAFFRGETLTRDTASLVTEEELVGESEEDR